MYRLGIRAFDFDVGRNPWPSIDGDFNVIEFPFFSVRFLNRFDFKTASFEQGDAVFIATDFDTDFFHTVNSEGIEVLVAHSDAVALVADTGIGMFAKVKNCAAH